MKISCIILEPRDVKGLKVEGVPTHRRGNRKAPIPLRYAPRRCKIAQEKRNCNTVLRFNK